MVSPPPDVPYPYVEPPKPLKRHQHKAVRADVEKTALLSLMEFRPTHLIFDFIDERFDLLRRGEALICRSWELTVSGYLDQVPDDAFQRIPRLSSGCDRLWADAASEMAAIIGSTPLKNTRVILHSSRWATVRRGREGEAVDLPSRVDVLPGEDASIADHNALLERYDSQFLAAFPEASVVATPYREADESHRWGLSPFHYGATYYEDIRRQLAELGVD